MQRPAFNTRLSTPHPLNTTACAVAGMLTALGLAAHAQTSPITPEAESSETRQRQGGVVVVTGSRPSSLPTYIPTVVESITARQIGETVNARDSEDALKYFPSLLVRKRYDGDYNHAVLSSRASGTGNSARSAVYADGILLSNYLGNGVSGLSFPPRWGLVTPEEIERVDVLYGPFSAAYPGNSVGAVVDYITRMPTKFEAHGKVGYSTQPFDLYNTHETYRSWQTSAGAGSREGALAWYFNASRAHSEGQPLTFATRLLSKGSGSDPKALAVTGAVLDKDNTNAPWYVLGTGTQYTSVQDHLKLKLAYDFTPTIKGTYTGALWQNRSDGRSSTYLSDANGNPFYSGPVNINGSKFDNSNPSNKQALDGGAFPLTQEAITHVMHGLALKSRTNGVFDWEAMASLYEYQSDRKRQNAATNPLPGAASGGSGTLADGSGSGWRNVALKGIWRPDDPAVAHRVDFGVQQDDYTLRYRTSNIAGNWMHDAPGSLASNVEGQTQLRSLYTQDVWAIAPQWKSVIGGRVEWWTAYNGRTQIPGAGPALDTRYDKRSEFYFSPKAALSREVGEDVLLKGSVGRAVRVPTVFELYGATSTANSQYINDQNLRPERSITTELSVEKSFESSLLRLTAFSETTRDGIYSQSIVDPNAGNRTITRVQNVDRVDTTGVETVWSGRNVLRRGLDLSGSVTYADSVIKENAGFVATAGDTIGKQQPNIPHWRATALATQRWSDAWVTTVAARYSGRQFRTLNNSDVKGYTYMGVSPFFVVDLRAQWRISRELTVAFGIDNLNNRTYWNFHPYPQRTYSAELKIDL